MLAQELGMEGGRLGTETKLLWGQELVPVMFSVFTMMPTVWFSPPAAGGVRGRGQPCRCEKPGSRRGSVESVGLLYKCGPLAFTSVFTGPLAVPQGALLDFSAQELQLMSSRAGGWWGGEQLKEFWELIPEGQDKG